MVFTYITLHTYEEGHRQVGRAVGPAQHLQQLTVVLVHLLQTPTPADVPLVGRLLLERTPQVERLCAVHHAPVRNTHGGY